MVIALVMMSIIVACLLLLCGGLIMALQEMKFKMSEYGKDRKAKEAMEADLMAKINYIYEKTPA